MSGYATQTDNASPNGVNPSFAEALKNYQAEVARIQEERMQLMQTKAKLEGELESLSVSIVQEKRNLDNLKREGETLSKDLETRKASAAKEVEDLRTSAMTEINADRAKLMALADQIQGERENLIVKNNSLLELNRSLSDKEAALQVQAEKSNEEQSRISKTAQDLKDKETELVNREKAVKEKEDAIESTFKGLNAREANLSTIKLQLDLRERDLSGERMSLDSQLADVKAVKKVIEDAQAKLSSDKSDFESARNQLVVREMAVAEAERQVKNWENDLKQRESLLASKYKGA